MPYTQIENNKIYYGLKDHLAETNLILIHGAGGNHTHWAPALRKIPGVNTHALDLPGHGLSVGSPLPDIGAYARFIENFVETLALTHVTLAGSSMGGAIALTLAIQKKPWLKKLILMGTGAKLPVNPQFMDHLKTKPQEAIGFMASHMYSKQAPETLVNAARDELLRIKPSLLVNDFKACSEYNLENKVQGINIPTLILVGEHDKMTPPSLSAQLHQAIHGSSLHVIPNAGHALALEAPEACLDLIEKFVP
ncbi:MAG TPA: hypothetical protein DDW49_11240 [Deltaproteobacteria bacterium]|nr:hypothetical protein [Deltaproteobacteria bacterium]